MYSYLKGILATVSADYIVLDVQGIGYLLYIPARAIGNLPVTGTSLQFFTSYIVREFSHTLYGFLSAEERDIFEIFINITGVGPKLALSLIGHLTMQELQKAVSMQDLQRLCRVPGVGKKTAERLIVELKDKLPALLLSNEDEIKNIGPLKGQHVQDAMLALIHLGYHQSAAQKALKKVLHDFPDEEDVSTLITSALKNV